MYPHFGRAAANETDWFEALASLARYLRGPDGCPWDRKQTVADFARFLGEEAEELREAVAANDNAHVAEEFGDVFFVLLAVAAAAEEEGRFRLEDALNSAHEKMIRRHGHVFGETNADTPEQAVERWNEVKAQERAAKNSER